MRNEKYSHLELLESICSSFRSPTWCCGIVMNEILLAMLPRMSQVYIASNTVELLNKGHYGVNDFVLWREVVPIAEVK